MEVKIENNKIILIFEQEIVSEIYKDIMIKKYQDLFPDYTVEVKIEE